MGIAGLLLAVAGAHATDVSPHRLLDRMNEAVRTLDYEGRFVVQSGDQLDAMYLVHRAGDGSEKERVVSLTGEPREIIRSDQAVACLVPGQKKPINVSRRAKGRSFSPLRGVSAEQLDRSYRMEVLAPTRVAGREADQILVEPRDDLRFGYRLYLDRESALPLRTVTVDQALQTVSQMMFVELRVNDRITPIEYDLSAMQVATADPSEGLPLERLAPAAWSFAELPAGFELNVHRRRAHSDGEGEREHFVFSDGLASVSVYVQPATGSATLAGPSRLGAAKAVGRLIDGYEVIVVGEVPVKTLEWFAAQIRPSAR